jgi:hypothetical protein
VSAPARAPRSRRGTPPSRRTAPATRARPTRTSGSGAARPKATGWSQARLVGGRAPQAVTRTGPRRAPFVLLIAGLLIGGLCALLALNTAAAAQELRRQSLTQSNADASDNVQQLKAELAAKQAPDALGRAAAALGMVPAEHPAFLRVLPSGTVKVMGSALPASAAPVPTPSAPASHHTTTAQPTPAGHRTPSPTPTPSKPTSPVPSPTGGAR